MASIWTKTNVRKIEEYYKEILTWFAGYPSYKDNYVEATISNLAPSEDDIAQFRSVSDVSKRKFHILITIFYTTLFLLSVCHSTSLFYAYNYEGRAKNFEPIKDNIVKFKCIYTNCTRFSKDSSQRETDYLIIPYVTICHPTARQFMLPMVDLGLNGLFLYLIMSLGIFTFCLVTVFAQFIQPIGDDSILYLVAPDLVTQTLKYKMLDIYRNLLTSIVNYRAAQMTRLLNRANLSDEEESKLKYIVKRVNNNLEKEKLIRIRSSNLKEDQLLNHYITDCLPMNRLNWWRNLVIKSCRNYISMLPMQVISNIVMTYCILRYWMYRRQISIRQVGELMESDNCAMWTLEEVVVANDADITIPTSGLGLDTELEPLVEPVAGATTTILEQRMVDLKNLKITFGVIPFFLFVSYSASSIIEFSSLSLGCMINQLELINGIHEIHSQMKVIIELVRLEIVTRKKDSNLGTISRQDDEANCETTNSQADGNWDGKNDTNLQYHYHSSTSVLTKRETFRQQNKNVNISFSKRKLGTKSGSLRRTNPNSDNITRYESFEMHQLINNSQATGGAYMLSQLTELYRLHNNLDKVGPMVNKLSDCLSPSKSRFLNDRIHKQQLASSIYVNHGVETIIDLSEKLYIKFRIFNEMRVDYAKSIKYQCLYSGIASYFSAALIVFLLIKIPNFNIPYIFAVICYIHLGICVYLMARFNSLSQQFVLIIWDLVAISSQSNEYRLEHIRHLWIKFIVVDQEAGIELKIFGVKLTYLLITKVSVLCKQ